MRQPHSLKVGAVLDTRSLPGRGISEESKPMLASLETVALLGSCSRHLGTIPVFSVRIPSNSELNLCSLLLLNALMVCVLGGSLGVWGHPQAPLITHCSS